MTTILHKRGAGKPSADDLSVGELALDTSAGAAYTKLSNGTVVEIGGSGGDGNAYDDTQIKADLAQEIQDREDGDQFLQDQIDALPSGGGGGSTVSGKAKGGITLGQPVIVNADGTFSNAGPSYSALPTLDVSSGSKGNPYTSNPEKFITGYHDPTGQVLLVAYEGQVTKAVLLFPYNTWPDPISGPTTVIISDSGETPYSVCYDSGSDRFLLLTINYSTKRGKCSVLKVTGDAISVDETTIFDAGQAHDCAVGYDPQSNKSLIVFSDSPSGATTFGRVADISGGSLSFTAPASFESDRWAGMDLLYHPTEKVFVSAYQSGSGGTGAFIADINNGQPRLISKDAPMESSFYSRAGCIDIDPQGRVLIGFSEGNSTTTLRPLTVSGGNITWDVPNYTDDLGNGIAVGVKYDRRAGNFIVQQLQYTYEYAHRVFTATYENGSLIKGAPATVNYESQNKTGSAAALGYIKDGLNDAPVAFYFYGPDQNTEWSRWRVIVTASSSPALTADNYIGIAENSASEGSDVTVLTAGSLSDDQKGLTPAFKHYVRKDGTISTTPDSPNVFAGTAISSTGIIVKG